MQGDRVGLDLAETNGSLRRSLIYGLLLFWLALGWQIDSSFMTNIYLWAIVMLLGGWFLGRNGPKPLTWPLLLFWSFGLFVSVLSRDADSIERLYFWAVLIAVYHIPHDLNDLRRGARWVSWPIFILSGAGLMWASTHIMAMFVWGFFWLGMPKEDKRRYLYTGVASWSIMMTRSEGGMLAMLAGWAIWSWLSWPRRRNLLAVGLVIGLATAWVLTINIKLGADGFDGSVLKRLEFYKYAWAGFVRSPIIGHGVNTYSVHTSNGTIYDPHNLILTILWETGGAGLLISFWLIFRLILSHKFDTWAAAWLATFISHSMVSIPFNSLFTAVTLFIILGGLPCKGKITLAWAWPLRWAWPWPACLCRPQ